MTCDTYKEGDACKEVEVEEVPAKKKVGEFRQDAVLNIREGLQYREGNKSVGRLAVLEYSCFGE